MLDPEFDDWELAIFDENGNHSEPLYQFIGTWEGVQRVFKQDVTPMLSITGSLARIQTRIVISRIM